MRLEKNRPGLARDLAGYVPRTSKVMGIINGFIGRNNEVLVHHQTGVYVTMLAGVTRTINPIIVRALMEG